MYTTTNLSEAAALLANKIQLIEISKIYNPKKQKDQAVFSFVHEAEVSGRAYWEGKLMVNAKEYSMQLRELKDRINNLGAF
jgi:hypothetical protein